ncbi:unnamed protein product, partial [Ixodes hexagonus]
DVPLQIDEDASPPPSPPRAPSPLPPSSSSNRKRVAEGSVINGHGNPDREIDRDRNWDRDRGTDANTEVENESRPPKVNRRRSSESREEQSEEEKIREYLGRSDTAVIYPEPVEPAKTPVAPDSEGE